MGGVEILQQMQRARFGRAQRLAVAVGAWRRHIFPDNALVEGHHRFHVGHVVLLRFRDNGDCVGEEYAAQTVYFVNVGKRVLLAGSAGKPRDSA